MQTIYFTFAPVPFGADLKQGLETKSIDSEDQIMGLAQKAYQDVYSGLFKDTTFTITSDRQERNFFAHMRLFQNQTELPALRRVVTVEANYQGDRHIYRLVELPCPIVKTGPMTSEPLELASERDQAVKVLAIDIWEELDRLKATTDFNEEAGLVAEARGREIVIFNSFDSATLDDPGATLEALRSLDPINWDKHDSTETAFDTIWTAITMTGGI